MKIVTNAIFAFCKRNKFKVFPLGLLLIFIILFYLGPRTGRFPSDVPKDSQLVASFWEHHEAFEKLSAIALEDSERVSEICVDTLSDTSLDESRKAQYRDLLEQIKGVTDIGIDDHLRVLFSYSGGGEFLAINRSWGKGIAYYPDGPSGIEKVVNDLDHLGDRDGIYLVPLEKNWYLIYQDLD
jgi:hypothetical protein